MQMRRTAIETSGYGERVLVCNDDRQIARLLKVNLERLGYSVDFAFDGREAIEGMEETDDANLPLFHRVLLDVMIGSVSV